MSAVPGSTPDFAGPIFWEVLRTNRGGCKLEDGMFVVEAAFSLQSGR